MTKKINSKTKLTKKTSEEVQPEGFADLFKLDSDGIFPQHLITAINLPKLTTLLEKDFKVKDCSSLVVQVFNEKPVSSNILNALKNGLTKFEIQLFDSEEIFTTWVFKNPKIVAVDFGDIASLIKPHYRTINCEIDFSEIEIDGITIKVK